MHLEIPEGANVQIIVGSSAPLALADESRKGPPAQTGGRPILKGLVVAIALRRHIRGRAAFRRTGGRNPTDSRCGFNATARADRGATRVP